MTLKFYSMYTNIRLNEFFKKFSKKKQYIKSLKKQLLLLKTIKYKNYKLVYTDYRMMKSLQFYQNNLIAYIIDITFSKSNTFLNVTDVSGKTIFFCSSGFFQFKGKNKKARFNVFKSIYRTLITKLKFLKNKPVALHLKNVGFNKTWLIKKLKTRFFIKIVKIFNLFPFNGCRNKKIRRKKFKKRRNG